MSARNFRFKSPGIRIEEIDQSFVDDPIGNEVGPVIVGRSPHGPSLKPVKVNSVDEFTKIFGNPSPGGIADTDQWRGDNNTSAHYGAYAAMAYLQNSAPVTFIRLAGFEHPNATATTGEAGWKTTNTTPATDLADNGGAYGLWLIPSASDGKHTASTANDLSTGGGTLAAIIYSNSGSGVSLSSSALASTSNTTLHSYSSTRAENANIKLHLSHSQASGKNELTQQTVEVSFDPTNSNFIRKVLNTSPILTNTALYNKPERYWLGETFETNVKELKASDGNILAFIAPLGTGSISYKADYTRAFQQPKTGWVFSQHTDLAANFDPIASTPQELFRFVGLSEGEWASRNLKISISNVSYTKIDDDAGPYGSFNVEVRLVGDSDRKPAVLERFEDCNINPRSSKFVGRVIGTQYLAWDPTNDKMELYDDYPNQSKYIRVELDQALLGGGVQKNLVPFGFMGPARRKKIYFISGSTTESKTGYVALSSANFSTLANAYDGSGLAHISAATAYTASVRWPDYQLRKTASNASTGRPQNAYFGIQVEGNATSRYYNSAYIDLTYPLGGGDDSWDKSSTTEHTFAFSLDDVQQVSSSANGWSDDASWAAGNRKTYSSISGKGIYYKPAGAGVAATIAYSNSAGWKTVLDAGYNKFTMPLHGGFDGVNIKERNPFANRNLTSTNLGQDNYAYFSILTALKMLKDPEFLDFNLAAVPGLENSALNQKLADYCEERGDALAILDVDSGFRPPEEIKDTDLTSATNRGTVKGATDYRKDSLSNVVHSYAACYYPWLKIFDPRTDSLLDVPPSVAMMGVFGNVAGNSEPWFAPAGFARGGLSDGSSGIRVLSVKDRLTSSERDELYENGINPIANFPAEGIVVYGQKTLQLKRSALDRINVRRLMIFLKRQISAVASRTLFEQNLRKTWQGFADDAEAILAAVKDGLGLVDYKFILDEKTTTPDLIDQNILYAKLYVKPARSIEFIALDFIITGTGAEFPE